VGNGEVTGNQSVHWRINHDNGKKPKVNQGNPNRPTGDDEVNVDDLVQGRDPSKADHVMVRMRFIDKAEADKELQAAQGKEMEGHYYVTIRVPLLARKNPNDSPPADVRVDWSGSGPASRG